MVLGYEGRVYAGLRGRAAAFVDGQQFQVAAEFLVSGGKVTALDVADTLVVFDRVSARRTGNGKEREEEGLF